MFRSHTSLQLLALVSKSDLLFSAAMLIYNDMNILFAIDL